MPSLAAGMATAQQADIMVGVHGVHDGWWLWRRRQRHPGDQACMQHSATQLKQMRLPTAPALPACLQTCRLIHLCQASPHRYPPTGANLANA